MDDRVWNPFGIDYEAELQAMKDEWAWVDAKFKARKKAERRAAFIESLRTLELPAQLTKDQPELLSLESCRPGRTRHRYGWRHIKVDSHTPLSTLPRGEHLPKCAKDVPSELFNNIIWHVNHLCLELTHEHNDIRRLVRQLRPNSKSPDDHLSSLKACSLVCLHWAVQSRQHMYTGSVLYIQSKGDFEIALEFATRGCPTLAETTVLRAVPCIDVLQRYDTPRSFYHLLLHPLTRHKLRCILLQGPIPEQFPRCFVNTPHWRLPLTLITTPSYPRFVHSMVCDIHFPSFRHIIKYIKYFSLSPGNTFREITWDKGDSDVWVPPSTKYRSVHGRNRTSTTASSCTDNSQLCLQAALTNPHCMLLALPTPERDWLLQVMRAYTGYYHQTDNEMKINTWKFYPQGPEILVTMNGYQMGTNSTMSIYMTNPYRDGDHFEEFRVEGILVYIEDPQVLVDLVALRRLLIAHKSLRVVYFVFRAQSILWLMVRKRNPEGLGYLRSELQMPVEGDGPKFGLGCRRSKSLSYEDSKIDHIKGTYMDDETTCFDMDLDKLLPTGDWWDDDDAMMYAFLGRE